MGGSCSRKIKIAIVSYIGHDLRMVDASWSGLIEAVEPDLFALAVNPVARLDAWPGRPSLDAATP